MCIYQLSSVAQSCPTLCDPMNHSTPGLLVHHHLPEFTQTHIQRVSDAIQPSHPLLSPSPPAPNPSQHQSLFFITEPPGKPNLKPSLMVYFKGCDFHRYSLVSPCEGVTPVLEFSLLVVHFSGWCVLLWTCDVMTWMQLKLLKHSPA